MNLAAQPRLVEPDQGKLVFAVEERGFESSARSAGHIIHRDDLAANRMNLIQPHRRDGAFGGFKNIVAGKVFDEIAKLEQADGAEFFGAYRADAGELFNRGGRIKSYPLSLRERAGVRGRW